MSDTQGPRAWKDCPECYCRRLAGHRLVQDGECLSDDRKTVKPCPTCAAFHAAVDAAKAKAWDEAKSSTLDTLAKAYRGDCPGKFPPNPYRKGGTAT